MAKKAVREAEEAAKPLARYRAEELEAMRRIFFSPDAPYHALRSAFVRKEPAAAPGEVARPRVPVVEESPVCQG